VVFGGLVVVFPCEWQQFPLICGLDINKPPGFALFVYFALHSEMR
jgi:hypothetical protein